jgi:hypothetical protein
MLEKAYEMESNDPYIIKLIGWALYLIEGFLKGKKVFKKNI